MFVTKNRLENRRREREPTIVSPAFRLIGYGGTDTASDRNFSEFVFDVLGHLLVFLKRDGVEVLVAVVIIMGMMLVDGAVAGGDVYDDGDEDDREADDFVRMLHGESRQRVNSPSSSIPCQPRRPKAR